MKGSAKLGAALVLAGGVGELATTGIILVGQLIHPHHGKLNSVNGQQLIERSAPMP